jgi:hypothetical protein
LQKAKTEYHVTVYNKSRLSKLIIVVPVALLQHAGFVGYVALDLKDTSLRQYNKQKGSGSFLKY